MGSIISKAVKMPQSLPSVGMLKMKGLSVMGSCAYSDIKTGRMYLQEHVLLVVLEGVYIVRHGDEEYPVRKNEMVLLHKGIVIDYEKYGEEDSSHVLDYMMFFLKDELLHEFMKISNFPSSKLEKPIPAAVHSVNERLLSYVASLKPYFEQPEGVQDELIKLKMLELLFDILDADEGLMNQILQLRQQRPTNIVEVVEKNLLNPVSLEDLAYLSGRSLSTFKREFRKIYNEPAFQWIRNRRLEKAKELLTHSGISITDISLATGFENVSHFSKVWKKKYGVSPSAMRNRSAAELVEG
ncbi:helix-turn-helix domain-containing protein [Paenibacillus radicis (ex Gao et al. 2016)]|uniref:AraC family transcriptional regulator n=1 Tax=Paenibacillus radicis (ex Gao et al. 2016) TaxID=1737354 RepID=A0A917M4P9_9BACL|nr:helix-turn-helix domain-containing protein [Paenibacillus radicis (ex Gao et al. 2016)]GGG78633.1 AraC family transcriptional regulator [Paenibacillus radicis (ex Gao et al. 2016)]